MSALYNTMYDLLCCAVSPKGGGGGGRGGFSLD